MEHKPLVGLAMCGSYCTFAQVFAAAGELRRDYALLGIMSETAAETDTRFGTAVTHIRRLMDLTGGPVVTTIAEAEPLGPARPMDALVIAPCTGNTLAKLAHGLTDSAVTMAAKAHLRNGRPLVIAFSTNDGLSASAENIGKLLNRKQVFFVPFRQDDPAKKPRSLQADFSLLSETVAAALRGEQIQPILLGAK
ncbi:MAG: dipicolinate synthase subunit B [Oscillospiraceae bacterium]|nr:dipicolinate synthase subunit B [Oscillospiraceae bacterium]